MGNRCPDRFNFMGNVLQLYFLSELSRVNQRTNDLFRTWKRGINCYAIERGKTKQVSVCSSNKWYNVADRKCR